MNEQNERWVLLITPKKPHQHMVLPEIAAQAHINAGWLLVGTWSKHSDVPKGNARVKAIARFVNSKNLND